MSQDVATITVFSNVNNPLFRSNFAPNYYNPNIIHLYEYENDLKTCPCLVN